MEGEGGSGQEDAESVSRSLPLASRTVASFSISDCFCCALVISIWSSLGAIGSEKKWMGSPPPSPPPLTPHSLLPNTHIPPHSSLTHTSTLTHTSPLTPP